MHNLKLHKFSKQFVGYFSVALIGLLVDFLTLVGSKELLGLHYLLATIAGFCAGLIVVFTLSNRLIFNSPKIKSRKINFLVFGLIGLIGLIILSFLMWIFTDLLGVNYAISKICATIFVYLWNFFARRSLYDN